MDFASTYSFFTGAGCGYVLLGCVSEILHYLGMFLMFGFCFKVLRFGWFFKSLISFRCNCGGIPTIRLCLNDGIREVSKPKVVAPPSAQNTNPTIKGWDDPFKSSAQNANPTINKSSSVTKETGNAKSEGGLVGKEENEGEVVDEDELFDVLTLRKLVKTERQKANAALSDLEKERTAAYSSAEETMAMILRLQNEKSAAEIKANHFRRVAEERLEYDQEVIDSLQWTVSQHENQKSVLEEQIEMCREELRRYISDDELIQLEIAVSRDDGDSGSMDDGDDGSEYDGDGGSGDGVDGRGGGDDKNDRNNDGGGGDDGGGVDGEDVRNDGDGGDIRNDGDGVDGGVDGDGGGGGDHRDGNDGDDRNEGDLSIVEDDRNDGDGGDGGDGGDDGGGGDGGDDRDEGDLRNVGDDRNDGDGGDDGGGGDGGDDRNDGGDRNEGDLNNVGDAGNDGDGEDGGGGGDDGDDRDLKNVGDDRNEDDLRNVGDNRNDGDLRNVGDDRNDGDLRNVGNDSVVN